MSASVLCMHIFSFSLEGEDLVSLLKPDAWEFSKPVGALIAHELRAKAHVFAPDTPVMQVVKSAFVTTDAARRVNRVAITNGQDPPLINDIISQTDVVNYMMGSKYVVHTWRAWVCVRALARALNLSVLVSLQRANFGLDWLYPCINLSSPKFLCIEPPFDLLHHPEFLKEQHPKIALDGPITRCRKGLHR